MDRNVLKAFLKQCVSYKETFSKIISRKKFPKKSERCIAGIYLKKIQSEIACKISETQQIFFSYFCLNYS